MKKILFILSVLMSHQSIAQTVDIEVEKSATCNALEIYLTPSTSILLAEVTFTIRRPTSCGSTVSSTPTSNTVGLAFVLAGTATDASYSYIGFTANPNTPFPTISTRTLVLTIPVTGACNFEIADAPGSLLLNGTLNIVNNLGISVNNLVTNAANCTVVAPVELSSFTAQKLSGKKAKLNWSVSNEIDIDNYTIERSTDGAVYEKISQIKSKGNISASYELIDEQPALGINYYRIRVKGSRTNKDDLSKVIAINFDKILSGKTYPNPFGHEISIEVEVDKRAGEVFVELFDLVGKQLYFQKIQPETERLNVNVPTENLSQGTYIIRIKNGGNTWQHKITKQ